MKVAIYPAAGITKRVMFMFTVAALSLAVGCGSDTGEETGVGDGQEQSPTVGTPPSGHSTGTTQGEKNHLGRNLAGRYTN